MADGLQIDITVHITIRSCMSHPVSRKTICQVLCVCFWTFILPLRTLGEITIMVHANQFYWYRSLKHCTIFSCKKFIPRFHLGKIQLHRNFKNKMVEVGHHGGQKIHSSYFQVWNWWLVHIEVGRGWVSWSSWPTRYYWCCSTCGKPYGKLPKLSMGCFS